MSNVQHDFLKISGLRKSFGPVEVLKGVDLAFQCGEIHAFIGANGAGKSTLLGCLSGAEQPSSGRIGIGGVEYPGLTPRLAIEKGIGIIYQHFQVVEGLSIADNIFLGSEIQRLGVVQTREQERRSANLLRRLGVELDPRTPLEKLSVGERQIVEIARALRIEPQLLILDEPTAALSDREISALHAVVRHLAHTEKMAVVYVTHLIEEIKAIADKVTVLRDGAIVWTRPASQVNSKIIAQAIAPSSRGIEKSVMGKRGDQAVLQLDAYCSPYTGPIDLHVNAGEIVGVYGLMGSGRTDFLESLAGARAQRSGDFRLNGQSQHLSSPRDALDAGIALVASDRNEQSLFRSLSALENLLMPHLEDFARQGGSHLSLFQAAADDLKLHPHNPALQGGRFSGGNAQKLVMGRWLMSGLGIKVLLLDEPTQGVDIGARAEIYRLLRRFAEQGGVVLLASSDPTEILSICNRVVVLGHGEQMALIDTEMGEHELVHVAHGGRMATQEDDPASALEQTSASQQNIESTPA